MRRRSSQKPRPFEIVMDESLGETTPWDLDAHLDGCLVGYQTASSYDTAVYFALEALWGIARDVGIRAKAGKFDSDRLDESWIVSPTTTFEVPWIWIRSLATAWERYKTERLPLAQAFGLEGGKGRSPIIDKLEQMLDERAIAHWIWSRIEAARAAGAKIRIEDAVWEAAEKFGKSDETIRRAWKRFGKRERLRCSGGS